MAVSKAHIKATSKWESKAYFKTLVRFPKAKEEEIRAAAGESLNGFITAAVYEKMERMESPDLPVEVPNAETLEAIRELDAGGGETFETVEDLFESWDD